VRFESKFRVRPGKKLRLKDIDRGFHSHHESEKDAVGAIANYREKMATLQPLLYADKTRSVLVVLQALDAAGKDGTVNHVLSALNPQGASVTGFKQLTPEELVHDFLWRIHPQILSAHQQAGATRAFRPAARRSRAKLEDQRVRLHRARLLGRLHRRLPGCDNGDEPKDAPWFVIPSNHKWFRNLAVSQIVADAMEDLHLVYPKPTVDLPEIRREYHAAAREDKGAPKLAAAAKKTK
jgi:Polyphosphate kinase 2 (PPK2)